MGTYYWYIKYGDESEMPIGMLSFSSYEKYLRFAETWADEVLNVFNEYNEDYHSRPLEQTPPFVDYLMQSLAMACDSMGAPFEGFWDFRHTENGSLYIDF